MPKNILSIPTISRWATNPGSTIEPSDPRKATGWEFNYRIPARNLNWLLASQADAINSAIRMACINFNSIVNSVADDALIFQSGYQDGWFVCCADDGQSIYVSRTGVYWDAGAVLGTALAQEGPSSLVETGNGRVLALLGGVAGIQKSSNGGETFSAAVVPPWRVSGAVGAVGAAGALRNRTIFWRKGGGADAPATAYTDNVDSGSLSLPVTDIAGANVEMLEIIHITEHEFLAAKTNGECWYTIDGGLNWTARTSIPSSRGVYAMDTDGLRVLAACWDSTSDTPRIYYSDDFGVTWVASGTLRLGTHVASPIRDLRHVGGSVWILTGMFRTLYIQENIPAMVSTDNGLTWSVPGIFMDSSPFSVGAPTPWLAVGSDRVLMCRKSMNIGLSSLVLP